jgi:hypothetical protein
LAILNPFPNAICAEAEFLARSLLACRTKEWPAIVAATSNELLDFEPDCVLALTEASPKLTGFVTLGIMWNPPSLVQHAAHCARNTLTYDGLVPGSPAIRQYVRELLHSTRKDTPIADFSILPSCHRTPFVERASEDYFLFYVGKHWDGPRHADLLHYLTQDVPMHIYGPHESWRLLPRGYMGCVPFDGCTLLEKIALAGVALCIHTKDHRLSNVPSCRLFEAAAAGAVIIADEMEYTRTHFGDAVLYADLDQPAESVADEIAAHMDWIRHHPQEARNLARRAHRIFSEQLCLEEQFERLPAFVQQVGKRGHWIRPRNLGQQPSASSANSQCAAESATECHAFCANEGEAAANGSPLVEYIVRIDGHTRHDCERCVRSLKAQSYPDLGIILSCAEPTSESLEWTRKYDRGFASFKVVRAPAPAARSTLLWQGMRAASAHYVGVCDAADSLQPNHVSTLVECLLANKDAGVAYSGCVQVQDDPGQYFQSPMFAGPLGKVIDEKRELWFFEKSNPFDLIEFSSCIHENSWIARRDLLDAWILDDDPNLDAKEDLLLLLLLQERTRFVFSWRPTAEHHLSSSRSARAHGDAGVLSACDEIIRRRCRYLPSVEEYRRQQCLALAAAPTPPSPPSLRRSKLREAFRARPLIRPIEVSLRWAFRTAGLL